MPRTTKSKVKTASEPIKLTIAPNSASLCDECGQPQGTLFRLGGRMLCLRDMPFEYKYGNRRGKLLSMACSGIKQMEKCRKAIRKARSA